VMLLREEPADALDRPFRCDEQSPAQVEGVHPLPSCFGTGALDADTHAVNKAQHVDESSERHEAVELGTGRQLAKTPAMPTGGPAFFEADLLLPSLPLHRNLGFL